MLQDRLFLLWRQDPAAISGAVARSSIVLCNSAPADRTVMAASRLLGAMAACVILLSFAAGHQNILESLHQGCDIVIGQQIFSILTRGIFLSQFLYKVLQNRLFLLWRRDPVLELQFLAPLRVVLLRFATRPLQIALWWLRQGCFAPRRLDIVNRIEVAASRLR